MRYIQFNQIRKLNLKYNNLRVHLQGILKAGVVSDEELLHEISIASSVEQEHINKVKLKASINEVSKVDSAVKNSDKKENSEKAKNDNTLLSEINRLSAKVSELSSVHTEIQDIKKHLANLVYKDFSVREEQVDSKIKSKLMRLIGVRPMLKCFLDDEIFEVLWDTGSMVSLVDTKWVKTYFPDKQIHPITDFLENQTLRVQAANLTEISFEGVILLKFSLKKLSKTFTVPILVTDLDIKEPILGFNVIEYLIMQENENSKDLLKTSFRKEMSADKISLMVYLIQEKAKFPVLGMYPILY